MPNKPLTNRTAQKLVQLILIGLAAQFVVMGYVFYQSYAGRVNLVDSQRAGCERGKVDRKVNAQGWRIAEAARRAEHQIAVADKYAAIAQSLEGRSRIDCVEVFPNPGVLP